MLYRELILTDSPGAAAVLSDHLARELGTDCHATVGPLLDLLVDVEFRAETARGGIDVVRRLRASCR